jgi:hypothetical protein
MKFEYKVITITDKHGDQDIEKLLNHLGDHHWELVGSFVNGGLPAFVLKLPRPDEGKTGISARTF